MAKNLFSLGRKIVGGIKDTAKEAKRAKFAELRSKGIKSLRESKGSKSARLGQSDDYDPYAAFKANEPDEARFGTPAIQDSDDLSPMIQEIFTTADRNRNPGRLYQEVPAGEGVFGPADTALTKEIVPQESIAHLLPPKPELGSRLPAKNRAEGILANEDALGARIADKLTRSGEDIQFYGGAGPVIMGLVDRGILGMEDAQKFMKDWAMMGAATSTRTETPMNLRNSSLMQYLQAEGKNLDAQQFGRIMEASGYGHNSGADAPLNFPGFRMMDIHKNQAGRIQREGSLDMWNNPKPSTFGPNWWGNLADPTADTHAIRAVLDEYDQLDPGGLPRGWFTDQDAFERYLANGGFEQGGMLPIEDISHGLQGQTLGGIRGKQPGRKAQTEYPIIQGPLYNAAERMGISPAEVQERLWFDAGPRTGLQSPRFGISDLLNQQIDATARATGVDPETILRLWGRRRIPLADAGDMNIPGASAAA